MENPFNTGFYDSVDLRKMGFARVGDRVQVAKNCTIVGLQNISFGDHVRIDAMCSIIATGPAVFGGRNHIGAFCHLVSRGGLEIEMFAGLSQRVSIYTASDDYGGEFLTNPTVPEQYTQCAVAPVRIGRHAIIGSGSVILPGVTICEGASVGALSLVTKSLEPWTVYSGTPARRLKERSRNLLALEAQLETDSIAD
jgi:acetyltransferase-like isoleucine patch superfamily enzyme